MFDLIYREYEGKRKIRSKEGQLTNIIMYYKTRLFFNGLIRCVEKWAEIR